MDSLKRKLVLISRGFHLAFTDTEYSEIINYIEEEYDYQYAKMGFHSFLLSMYSERLRAADGGRCELLWESRG